MTKVIKVGQENVTGKCDRKKVLLKLLLTRAKKQEIREIGILKNNSISDYTKEALILVVINLCK